MHDGCAWSLRAPDVRQAQRFDQDVEGDRVLIDPRGEDLGTIEFVHEPPPTSIADRPGGRLAHPADEVGAVLVRRRRRDRLLRRNARPASTRSMFVLPHRTLPPRSAKKFTIAAAAPITSAAPAETSAPDRPRADQ